MNSFLPALFTFHQVSRILFGSFKMVVFEISRFCDYVFNHTLSLASSGFPLNAIALFKLLCHSYTLRVTTYGLSCLLIACSFPVTQRIFQRKRRDKGYP